ncbi:hypothetical protein WMY93_001186 [Mugilogobius chulae]|uniref:Nucleoprotein TPR/MLP1-2 domain-containing protein n=1 Tax=Mugilogobius chulae TaxID=88201 RepID=A0AAW0Q2I6_9GOBI
MLRQAEIRLNKEKEAILTEQRNQNLLLTNLKTIQLTMERTETDIRQRLNNKIEQLESELTAMKTKLNQEVAQRHALGRSMDAQLLEAKKQLETQNTLQQKTRELLRSSEQQVAALKAQLASATSGSDSSNTGSTPATPAGRAAALRAPLRVSHSLEIRLKESQDLQKQLEQRILEVEKMKLKEEEERRKAVNVVEKQVIELQRTLKASQTEQREALERCTLAVTQEEKAIQESRQQTKIAEEAQAKYEKELMLHAADVEALQDLKKRFQEISSTKQEVEDKLNKNTALLQEKTATWSTVEKQLKENLSKESRRCEELGKQNSLLHKQMDELATKNKPRFELQQQNLDLSFSEEGKTTEQILEILRFVRREKEIAVAQFEASEGEALRYKQRVEYQDQELKELQEALNAERERMQTTAKTVAQQEQQLKKMEAINTLQETNRLLKLDKDKLEHELRIFRSKISKLQSDIAPLHQNLSVLSEKNGSLQADKRILEEDLKRWKLKVQQLTNQQKDGDVEEKQKLITERDAHLKRITHLTEESAKLKTELAKANASNNSAQSQLTALKNTLGQVTSERDTAKKELEAKNNDIVEKNKTITQVKKIGRRYKTQYEELKAQHDKLVQETAAKQGSEASADQEAQQQQQLQLTQAQEELKKAREELDKNKEEMQKKVEEVQKSKQELEEIQKENQQTKEKFQELQNQLNQSQTQLTQVQTQLTQTQNQLQQNQNQLNQGQKELQQAKTQSQQFQNQLKSAQNLSQNRLNQIQEMRKELQQAKENLQQKEKELQQTQQSSQQTLNQEVNNLKTSLNQAEAKVTELQGQLDNIQKTLGEREAEVKRLEEQLSEAKQATEAALAAQTSQPVQGQSSDGNTGGDAARDDELAKLKQELTESKNREEQLRQQMADKEEKTKKAFLGAKTKIGQLNSAKEQLSKEVEELKQDKEEQEVRMNAIKSQYEMRLSRLDRELRELRETQTEAKEEPQDQASSKAGGDQTRTSEQRQISLKSPAQDRGSSSLSEPPTANIRPTPSTPSPSSKPSPTPGSKATPRASIRPMVTPPSVPTPTPTATVMPTTQADSQEASLGSSASVHSTSSGLSCTQTMAQPTSSQATAFVQPTQQQAANQEPGPVWRQSVHRHPLLLYRLAEEEDEGIDEELGDSTERPDSADSEMGFPVIAADDEDIEDEGVSQSVPSDQSQTLVRDVIVIDTDSESRESKETEKRQEEEDDEEEEDEEEEEQEEEFKDDEEDDEDDEGSGDGGLRPAEGSNEESRDADEEDEEEPSESVRSEDKPGGASTERAAEPSHSGESRSGASLDADHPRELPHLPPLSSSSSVPGPSPSSHAPRLPQPRRPPHSVPPRLYIQPPPRSSDPLTHSSPQVAGLSTRFRFGPPEDLLPQASASHSDLGQLASQGGLGMYESPLFLAAHDEDGGGRSVPTTPLQVAAPVTVFTESLPSDGADNMASQSVPMVTASTAMSSAADDGDEVFMEHEAESAGLEPSLDSQADLDSAAQQSEDAALPSTSQDPDTSSATQGRTLPHQPLFSSLLGRGSRGRGEGRTLISRRGPYYRGGRGSMGRGGFF